MGCLEAINNVGLVTLLVMASMMMSIQDVPLAVAGDNDDVWPAVAEVPAVYVFGDSTVDVGNNNYLPGDFPRADHPYYGVDFPGGRSTGRWSNGYNLADFVARSVGFRRSPPAYLSLSTRAISKSRRRLIREGHGGVNYASAGAGILDSTNPGNGKYVPLSQQLRYFGVTRADMVATLGASAATHLLSRSLFLISIGTNDIGVFVAAQHQQSSPPTNTSAAGGQPQGEVAAAYLSSIVSNYSAAITELYGMGARRFAIVNVGLIGCAPWARLQSPTAACAAAANALAAGFNAALLRSLRLLVDNSSSSLRGFSYSVGGLHGLMQATMASPAKAGLWNVDSACCGSGRLGAQSDCRPSSTTTLCVDRRRYLFWDSSGHPTQRAAQLIASTFYDGPAQFTVPINFKQLVQSA